MFDRITHDPNVLAGRAALRGLRISVAHVVNLVANGMTPAQIVSEYSDLEEEYVRQALGYAAVIAEDQVHLIPGTKIGHSSPIGALSQDRRDRANRRLSYSSL